MSKPSEWVLAIAVMAALAAAMFIGGYRTGRIQGFKDGADATMKESVNWCADAINRVCPDPDLQKLLPQPKQSKGVKT